MTQALQIQNNKRFATVKELPSLYPHAGITEASIRWIRFNNTSNFNQCIRKMGRRILIDIDAFEKWLDGNNETGR